MKVFLSVACTQQRINSDAELCSGTFSGVGMGSLISVKIVNEQENRRPANEAPVRDPQRKDVSS